MKFQFQSDIHLEVGSQYESYTITPTARYLILAGDIGNLNQYEKYVSFLRVQCQNFEKVFLCLGNHEFYNITRSDGLELAERMTHEPGCQDKLVLLHRQRFDIDLDIDVNEDSHNKEADHQKVTILGCTLNSSIPESKSLLTRMKVSDFSKIHDWTVQAHNAEHTRDVTWLRDQLHELQGTDRKTLIVTHHAPFKKGCAKPKDETADWHDAFASSLLEPELDEKGQPNILRTAGTWIFGHTHYTTECTVGGVRCTANQRGYVFPWQMKKPTDPNTSMDPASSQPQPTYSKGSGEKSDTKNDSPSSSITAWMKRMVPFQKKQTSFKVNLPGPMEGHQGDGSIPFDPLRYLEI